MWGLDNKVQSISGQPGTADADVDAPEAWNTAPGVVGTVVAVIDEGMDVSDPNLRNNVWKNRGRCRATASTTRTTATGTTSTTGISPTTTLASRNPAPSTTPETPSALRSWRR